MKAFRLHPRRDVPSLQVSAPHGVDRGRWRSLTAGSNPLSPTAAGLPPLPTRQVVVVVWPHPPVELVTIAATLERGWSSPAVPSACPGATSGPHPTRQQRTTPGNGGHLTSQLDSPSRPASQVVRPPRFSLTRRNPTSRPAEDGRRQPGKLIDTRSFRAEHYA